MESRSGSPIARKAGAVVNGLWQNRRAMAAVEAALIMPIFLMFLLGSYEAIRYVNMSRRLTTLANSMATMITTRMQPVNGNAVIFAFNSAMVIFPDVLSDPTRGSTNWWNYLSMTISNVLFTPTVAGCTTGCTYQANIDWSLGTDASRSCTIAPILVADSTISSLTTLPADVFNPGSLIVVDLSYPFVPLFGGKYIPSITIHRSAYLQPRYMSSVSIVNTGGPYGKC
jgi:Flp pilus assembly protein TadG